MKSNDSNFLRDYNREKIMQKNTINSNYFPALTGIRTVAASMVFLAHFNPFKAVWFGQFIHDSLNEFHVGVTIFFVLSGFLICYRYSDVIILERKWLQRYFVNRFARIYPMYFIMTVLSFIPAICTSYCGFKLLFLNLTFLRGFFDEYKFTGVPGGWSLTVEEMFYFLFPLIIFFSKKMKLFYQPVLFIALGILLWDIFKNISFHGFFSSLTFLFEYTFFGRCFEFYTGIFLALYVKSKAQMTIKKYSYRTTVGILYIITCVALLVINKRHSLEQGQFLFFETLVNNLILPLGIATLFYGLLIEKTWIRKMLETNIFTLLGKSSYIFYLIHNGFLFSFFFLTLHFNIVVIFFLMHGISITLYIFVEKPLNNLIRHAAYSPVKA